MGVSNIASAYEEPDKDTKDGRKRTVEDDMFGGGEVEPDDANDVRGSWANQIEFILTMLGFAVGLGNVWRFPYLCYKNGGGAFLIPYILMLLFVGWPVFYMETGFGQFASLGAITIWKINPLLKGVGWAAVTVAIIIVIYYNVIVAWCIYYFFASMSDPLPWVGCDNWWNTEYCYDGTGNITVDVNDSVLLKTPAEEYYYNNVLRLSDGIEHMGGIVWQLALCLFIAWVTIFFVIINGVQSLGKVSYFVSLFPYVLLTLLLIKGCTLPGAADGIYYYIVPTWDYLLKAQTWSDAATQIFYSLGCCMGSLIAMASFNPFKNNIARDACMVPFINCGTSIYAGFVIFSMLGYIADYKGVEVADVVDEGPGLIFVVYPDGLATMSLSWLWAILFFFMMVTLGFSSQFSTAESCIAAVLDECPTSFRRGLTPTWFRLGFCVCGFLLGLPQVCEGGFYLFNLVDIYCAGYPLLIIGFCELGAIFWWYGWSLFSEDLAMMLGSKPGRYFHFLWCFLTPLIIFVIVIFKAVQEQPLTWGDYVYPDWAQSMAWLLAMFPVTIIVLYFFFRYMYDGGWRVLVDESKATAEWGPSLDSNRTGRYALPEDEFFPERQIYMVPTKSQPDLREWIVMTNKTDSDQGMRYRSTGSERSDSNQYQHAWDNSPSQSNTDYQSNDFM